MCGRFNVTDNIAVRKMMSDLDMPLYQQDKLLFSTDVAPGARISIIRQVAGETVVSEAIWWLMLDMVTLKPNYDYASFNSRSDKLHTPRALAFRPYRERRCIIPASAFIEGLGDGKTYHKIEIADSAIAFGGVYREWVNVQTGETALSASIITCPPVPEWDRIHPKSTPLMLPADVNVRRAWLNPEIQDVAQFEPLLTPSLERPQVITPIGKVSKWNEIGPSFTVPARS